MEATQEDEKHPGVTERIYGAICRALSGSGHPGEWDDFSPQDWELLPEIAQAENVGPLLYWKFKEDGFPPSIPMPVAASLMQQYFASASDAAARYRALDLVLAVFQAARVPVILLKGIVFAKSLYPEPALRPMLDIDLLVQQKDQAAAAQALAEHGFTQPYRDFDRALSEQAGHHDHFHGPDDVSIELHWSLISGAQDWRTPAEAWAWSNVAPVDFLAQTEPPTAWCLNPAANLLYLCAHAALQHGLSQTRLAWYMDVHLLVCKYGQDFEWEAFAQQAQDLGWASACGAALEGTRDRFGAPIPDGVIERLQALPSPDAALVRRKSTFEPPYEQIAAELAALAWPVRAKVILARLFPSPAFIRYHFRPQPGWIWPLVYPYRWLVIGANLARLAFRRIQNRRM
jgi:hypothetical protein